MKKSNTKRALGMSLISLLACGVMFAGSTYAWFTDEVTVSGNKIETGTLKVDLEVLEGTSWKSLRDSSEAVFSGGLWEPGYTDYAVFKVENEGNLAVKWNLKAVKVGADSKNLAEVIDVYALVSDDELENPTSLKEPGYEKVGTLADVLAKGTLLEGTFDANKTGAAKYLGIMLHMQEEAGNQYQGATDVTFDIKLNAYQLASEKDGFESSEYDSLFRQFQSGINNGGNVTLNENITLKDGAEETRLVLTKDAKVNFGTSTYTLDLPDATLDTPNWTGIELDGDIDVTFDGTTGGITTAANEELYGVYLRNGANLTINGGTYVGGSTAVHVRSGELTINGGFFDVDDQLSNYVINCTDANYKDGSAKVTIKGGTFVNFNPEDAACENPHADFVPEGYYVVSETQENGDVWYTVVRDLENIVLVDGEEVFVTGEVKPITVSGNGTLVLNNASIDAANSHALTVLSSDVKVEVENNVVLEGAAGYSGIYVPADVELDLSGTGYLTAIGGAGADSENGGHGIGGLGNINIHDLSKLTAKAYGIHAFGIGGASKEITITNTNIETVQGGYVQPNFINDTKYGKSEPEGGAAIGSSTDGAVITLKNSTVKNALGGSKSAAIGATYWTGVSINIDECTISYAQGGNASAAIGGSRVASDATRVDDVVININNSTINAVGGEFAAGIGSGYDTHCTAYSANTPITTINITGNSVITAQGGKYGAGIGTGYHYAGLAGNIESTVTVNAKAGESREGKYTVAQAVGFGVVDTTREGKDNPSSITYNGTVIVIPEAQ